MPGRFGLVLKRFWSVVPLLTSPSFELDHSASRLCEVVHGIFQGFRSASSICTCDGLNGLAQKISDVLLMCLSPSELCRKSTPQAMPDQTPFTPKTARNSH